MTTSSANTTAIADLPIASSDAANAASMILPSSRIQIRSTKKAEASSAVKRIVSHRKKQIPKHLEEEGFNSSIPLRATLRRNDVSIMKLCKTDL